MMSKDEALELAHDYGLIASKNKRAWVGVPEKRIIDFIDDIYFKQCNWPEGASKLWWTIYARSLARWFNAIKVSERVGEERECIQSQLLARYLLGKEAM